MPKPHREHHKRRDEHAPPTLAAQADRYELYQRAVQDPAVEIRFLSRVFKRLRGRKPRSFKEDFCGTAHLAAHWVASHRERTALAVDLDPTPLAWGRVHVLPRLTPEERARLTLVQANVLDVTTPRVDISCALNFSYCAFKQRVELRRYFEVAHAGLVDDGLFFCELFGGTEAIIALEEERDCDGFTYVWQQARYNPINRNILCHIHFRFPDGSRIKKAFSYDWRLWTIPEVRECLVEAGFSTTEVWWDPVDEDDYRRTEEEENQEGWLVYLVGIR